MHSKVAGALAGLVAAGAIVMGLFGVTSFGRSALEPARDGQMVASIHEARMTLALFDHHSIGVKEEKSVQSVLFDHHSTEELFDHHSVEV